MSKTGRNSGNHNRGLKLPAEILTPSEVRALILACSNRAPTGIRNRGLLTALYRGGLRISEALALAPKDLDPDRGTIAVLRGKGNRRRMVGLDPEGFGVLSRWLDRRAALGFNGRQPVFCTLAGRPMSSAYARALLPRLARRAGITKRVHPHGLRHTHAAELAAEAVPVHLIQRQLGHASVATTSRYIDHLTGGEVVAAMQARRWELAPPAAPRGSKGRRITGRIGAPDATTETEVD